MTVIALDVGGSTVRGALMASDATILTRHTMPTPDRDPGLRATRMMAEQMLAEATARRLSVRGIGAGFPEYVDPEGHLTSHEVLDWDSQPDEVLADLATTVVIDSDVRCGALGELHTSRTQRGDFVYISLGTGLSSALVCDGVVRRGARGEAIALGELWVEGLLAGPDTPSLEVFASGAGVAQRYADMTHQSVSDGARFVVAQAQQGDPAAVEILTSAGRAVGHAIAQLVWLLDPRAIILGGGLGSADGLLRDAAVDSYARATGRRPGAPRIEPSVLGADAGLLGAGHLALSGTEGEGDRDGD